MAATFHSIWLAYLSSRRAQWLALALGAVALSLTTWATGNVDGFRPWLFEDQYDNAFEDLLARNHQIDVLQRTGNIYEPFGAEAFTYPPGAIFIFYWTTWLPTRHVPYLWTALTLVAMMAVFAMVMRTSGQLRGLALWSLASWLTMATVTLYPPFIEVLEWGQLAPMLLALLVLDELVLRGGWRGVGVGVASAIKLYPLVFVVAWMFRREWRSVATALLTFAATTTLASVLWPQSAWSFFVDLMWNGRDVSHLATNHATVVSSQSIASMLNRPPLALDASYQWVGLLVAAVVACAGLFGAHRLWLRRQHVGACVVLIALASLSSPVAWDHYFCFAPLLWWVASEATPHSRLRRSSVTAAIVLLVPWNFWRREKVTDLWISVYEFVTRNAIGFAALSVVLAAVLDAWKPQRNVVTTHPPSSSERVRPLL